MSSSPSSLRREVLTSFAILFAGGVALACMGMIAVYPFLTSGGQAVLYLGALLLGDLGVIFLFGRRLLETHLVGPVDRLVEDTERIAEGDYRHRVRGFDSQELHTVASSVNALADRLIAEQENLAENVESLERTNRELVAARTEVLRAARLASAGTLAAGIAHEVGNPLGAILGYVDVARMRGSDSFDPTILESIREEAGRIDRIVRGLLSYARPEGADDDSADPRAVVERVRDLLEQQGHLSGVAVRWAGRLDDGTEEGGDVVVVGMGAHRLEHVLMNLLLNSVEALRTTEDAEIVIGMDVTEGGASRLPKRRAEDPPGLDYAHRRRVATDQDEGGADSLWTASRIVTLTVEDNGPGILEADVDRIFDPFFTTKEPGEGTGLGLAICARIVEGMGGKIDVENREEGGARFVMRLPAAMKEAAA